MKISHVLAAAIAATVGSAAFAAPLTPGNLVVYRVGTGTGSLANTGNAVFLDEYTTSGSLVQSIAMPASGTGSNPGNLVASGTATSEGLITLSPDGQYIALTGYNAAIPAGSSLTSSTAANVNRVVGIVPVGTGVVSLTSLTDAADGNNIRSAVTTNGTDIYLSGGAGGVRYTTAGATTSTQLSTTLTNIRQVNVFAGQVYISTSSGSAVRIGAVGSGTPSTSGQTITNLPGIPTSGSPYGFYFADLSSSVAGVDTLYVAEDTASGGLIQKYGLVAGSWTAQGTVAATGVRGLTASVDSTGTVNLYGTTGGSGAAGGGTIYSFVDSTGYSGSISGTATSVATASANTAFRGIVYVVPEPSALSLITISGLAMIRRRRKD